MKWHNPDILFWLPALLLLLLISGVLLGRRQRRLARLAEAGLWPALLAGYSPRRLRLRNLLRVSALTLALTALARPQWGFRWEEVRQRGLSIIVALDTSKSMLAQDIRPNRLQQAKWGVRDLVKELHGDRIGLVAFAGDAFLQCPATIDYPAFLMMLDDVYAGIVPIGGTDLYVALKTAIDSFEKIEGGQSDKVIILISDGEGHTGDPLSLLPQLKKEGIHVCAIGVGTDEGAPIETADGWVKNREGNVITSRLNESLLKRLALETGGVYVRSAPGDFGLDRVYREKIAELQREDRETRLSQSWIERFQWMVGTALLLLVLEAVVRPVRAHRAASRPRSGKGSARSLAALSILLIAASAQGEETPRSAMRKGLKSLREGDYTNAVAYLEKSVLEFPAIGHYNLGCAQYCAGAFEAADESFNEALHTTDLELQARAYFNRGNALLARTTALNGPEQIGLAIDLAFQAADMYEKAILLTPDDTAAKQNYERAWNLRLQLESNLGRWYFDRGEALLKEYKAKDAQSQYLQARKQFEHILRDIDPNHAEAARYLPMAEERLAMLKKAVEDAEADLADALQFIADYQYMLAAQRLTTDSDARKYAFDIKPDLKQRYEETQKKNSEVLKIIEDLSTLNTVR